MDSFFKQQVYTKIVLGGSAIKNNQFIPSQAVLFALELYQRFSPLLDEPARRQFLACIVEQGGYGAQSYVQAVTGINPHALERGHDEIQDKNLDTSSHRRQRKPGGGRKSIESIHPEIFDDLRMIIEDSTYGDPCKPLSYTTMSEAKIVEALDQGVRHPYFGYQGRRTSRADGIQPAEQPENASGRERKPGPGQTTRRPKSF